MDNIKIHDSWIAPERRSAFIEYFVDYNAPIIYLFFTYILQIFVYE